MEKVVIPGLSGKELLKASAADKCYTFLLAGGDLRGVVVNATLMTNQMKANHNIGVLETLALGHAGIGAALMAANLKGNDRLCVQIDCNGPLKGLSVEANAFGEVRGFLKAVPIPLTAPPEGFDLTPFIGEGLLSVTRYPENAKRPFTGKTALGHGAIALELANYFLVSEQTPTAFNLSVHFDREGWAAGAGGLLLQAMPGASNAIVTRAEEMVRNLPSIGKQITEDPYPWPFIEAFFASLAPQLLAGRRVAFMCHCNRGSIERMIKMLPGEELMDIARRGPFPLQIRCHNCNTEYCFDQEEIRSLAESEMVCEKNHADSPQ